MYMQLFGDREVAEKELHELFNYVRHFAPSHARVRVFGQLCGVRVVAATISANRAQLFDPAAWRGGSGEDVAGSELATGAEAIMDGAAALWTYLKVQHTGDSAGRGLVAMWQ